MGLSTHCTHCDATRLFVAEPLANPLGCAEMFGLGVLCVLTFGIGLLFAVPYAVWRGYGSSRKTYRCSQCGSKR